MKITKSELKNLIKEAFGGDGIPLEKSGFSIWQSKKTDLYGLMRKVDGVKFPAKYSYIDNIVNMNGMISVRDANDERLAIDISDYSLDESVNLKENDEDDSEEILFVEAPLLIVKRKDGTINTDFDSRFNTGWSYDSDDVAEAAAILLSSKFKDNKSVQDIVLTNKSKKDSSPNMALYWLTGGNTRWRFNQDSSSDFYKDVLPFLKESGYVLKIQNIINKSKTIGDLITQFDGINYILEEELFSNNFLHQDIDENELENFVHMFKNENTELFTIGDTTQVMNIKEIYDEFEKFIEKKYPNLRFDMNDAVNVIEDNLDIEASVKKLLLTKYNDVNKEVKPEQIKKDLDNYFDTDISIDLISKAFNKIKHNPKQVDMFKESIVIKKHFTKF